VSELEEALTVEAFAEWKEYFRLDYELRKKAMDKTKADARARKGRR
jgi:hypothetical protein